MALGAPETRGRELDRITGDEQTLDAPAVERVEKA